jgi:hypothetical protein
MDVHHRRTLNRGLDTGNRADMAADTAVDMDPQVVQHTASNRTVLPTHALRRQAMGLATTV